MSDYLICLAEMITDAVKECTPYDFDSDEAFSESMHAITSGHVADLVAFFQEFVGDLDEADRLRLYPSTMEVLPMLSAFGQH